MMELPSQGGETGGGGLYHGRRSVAAGSASGYGGPEASRRPDASGRNLLAGRAVNVRDAAYGGAPLRSRIDE